MPTGRSFWEISSVAANSRCPTWCQDPAGGFLATCLVIPRLVNMILEAMATSTGQAISGLKFTLSCPSQHFKS